MNRTSDLTWSTPKTNGALNHSTICPQIHDAYYRISSPIISRDCRCRGWGGPAEHLASPTTTTSLSLPLHSNHAYNPCSVCDCCDCRNHNTTCCLCSEILSACERRHWRGGVMGLSLAVAGLCASWYPWPRRCILMHQFDCKYQLSIVLPEWGFDVSFRRSNRALHAVVIMLTLLSNWSTPRECA